MVGMVGMPLPGPMSMPTPMPGMAVMLIPDMPGMSAICGQHGWALETAWQNANQVCSTA